MSPSINVGAIIARQPRDSREPHLNLSETFGPTIQGEGPNAGRLSSFVRLAGCNLTCAWCDSAYTWDWDTYDHASEVHATSVADAVNIISHLPGRIIVTGGEPLLQAPALAALMSDPRMLPRLWDVETNGTRSLGATLPYWDTIICSPKVIPSADQGPLAHRLDAGILSDNRAVFKFVVRDAADVDAVDAFVADRGLSADVVWLMPEGVTAAVLSERTPFVINAAVERGYNFSSRLHVYGWHDVRGH